MPSRRHNRAYRITAIVLAYLLLGSAIFVPLGVQPEPNMLLIYIVLGVYLAALAATIIINEILIAKRKKHELDS